MSTPAPVPEPAAERPRTRAAAKEASHEALVGAAIALFAEKGLDVSLDEICARAGYTRGAFYVHFKDRDELITVVMQQVGLGSLNVLLGAAEGADDLATVARRFPQVLQSGTYPLSRAGGIRPYQLLDACARSAVIREQYVALIGVSIARLAQNLRADQAAGRVRADIDAGHAAGLLAATVIGLHTMYDLEAPIDLAQGAEELLKLLGPPTAEA